LGEKRRLFLVRLDLQQDLHPVRRGGGFQNIADRGRPVYQANIFHFKDAAELQQAKWSGLESQRKADGTVTHDFYLNAIKPLILPKGVWRVCFSIW
jgi:hypothetical protein